MEILEKALKQIPGLTYVFAIAALLMLENNSELAAAIRVFVVAWLLYRISSSLDWIFNLFYGPKDRPPTFWSKTWWGRGFVYRWCAKVWLAMRSKLFGYRNLETSRNNARDKLHQKQTSGIYQLAKAKVGKEQWEKDVAPWLNISKAARAFIVPLLLVALLMAVRGRYVSISAPVGSLIAHLGDLPLLVPFRTDFAHAGEKLSFLHFPILLLVLAAVCSFVYVWLRIRHMNKLYEMVPDPATAQGATV